MMTLELEVIVRRPNRLVQPDGWVVHCPYLDGFATKYQDALNQPVFEMSRERALKYLAGVLTNRINELGYNRFDMVIEVVITKQSMLELPFAL